MNTPIERIAELRDRVEGYGFIDGYRACEQEYQRLWQEFIAEQGNKYKEKEYKTEREFALDIYDDFQAWLEDKQK